MLFRFGVLIDSEDPKFPMIRAEVEGNGPCLCDVCEPESAELILSHLHLLTRENFDSVMLARTVDEVRDSMGLMNVDSTAPVEFEEPSVDPGGISSQPSIANALSIKSSRAERKPSLQVCFKTPRRVRSSLASVMLVLRIVVSTCPGATWR